MLKAVKITKKIIEEQIIFVGLDVHYNQWNISVIGNDNIFLNGMSVSPDSKKLAEFLKRKFKCEEIQLAYEAGFCGFYVARQLQAEGINTIVINPADIPTSDKDSRYKTDKRDSLKIAVSLRAGMLECIYIPEIEDEQNQALFRRRMDLAKKQRRVKTQIKSLLKKYGIRPESHLDKVKLWTQKYIDWLYEVANDHKKLGIIIESMLRELDYIKGEMTKIEAELSAISQSEKYSSDYQRLKRIPGIGNITAWAILLELIDIGRFRKFSNLASYVGLIPTEHSSGDKQHLGHMTRRAKTVLKTLLVEAAWTTIYKDETFKKYYNSLKANMSPQEAIVRCAKKLLRVIYHILSQKIEYQINRAA